MTAPTPPAQLTDDSVSQHGLYPGAQFRPIEVNFSPGGNSPGLVVAHHIEGSLASADAWFRDPASQVSAHFGAGKDGELVQWVRAGDTAWHAAAANTHSIGVEFEGHSGEEYTPLQLSALAGILLWAHHAYAVPLWMATRPDTGEGLAWHGLGGVAWGDHPLCPGLPAVAQLPLVTGVAKLLR